MKSKSPHAQEAAAICYHAGLPTSAQPFIERMLSLEVRLAALEECFPEAMRRDLAAIQGRVLAPRESAAFAAPALR
jgi:hypothetical protein